MQVQDFAIEGLKLITVKKFGDDRGFFTERFKLQEFQNVGVHFDFIQDNHSRSNPQVLRGLHYQWDPAQAKLVTCLTGKIFDVAVDIRKGSKTYGQSVVCELDSANPQWFLIPAGFAHGFCVMGDEPADVLYKVNAPWTPASEGSILWNDPDLKISWPVTQPLLSKKDEVAPTFKEYSLNPKFSK